MALQTVVVFVSVPRPPPPSPPQLSPKVRPLERETALGGRGGEERGERKPFLLNLLSLSLTNSHALNFDR